MMKDRVMTLNLIAAVALTFGLAACGKNGAEDRRDEDRFVQNSTEIDYLADRIGKVELRLDALEGKQGAPQSVSGQ
jgi:hypothetical protein